MRREVIAARGVVTILLIFNSLLYDHLNAINFQSNESHVIQLLHPIVVTIVKSESRHFKRPRVLA